MNLEFQQELKNNDVRVSDVNLLFGTDGLDFDCQNITAIINFSVSIDERSWGIDGINTNVSDVVVNANINIDKEWLNENEIELLKSKGFKEYSDDLTFFNWELKLKQNSNDIDIDNDCLSLKQIAFSHIDIEISKEKDNVSIGAVVS